MNNKKVSLCEMDNRHKMAGSFQETIDLLDLLKSYALNQVPGPTAEEKFQLSMEAAIKMGLKFEDFDRLSIIHVTGTKGKGSTCAMIESILRRQGYRTGFLSSPHLVCHRERIRIGGSLLSREAFQSYFWQCYNKLCNSEDDCQEYVPYYFHFVTNMAFYVFLEEQVDVVILEVGVGGEYDATNIIRSPVVCGITSLEIDHVPTLGDTLEKIAWHKAGIFKKGSYALTVPQQDCAMTVLRQRSKEKQCPLAVVPSNIYSYDWGGAEQTLGIPGEKQELNASLAVQLCLVWTTLHGKSLQDRNTAWQDLIDKTGTKMVSSCKIPTFQLQDIIVQGLQKCYWPGRCQIIKKPEISYYVDGAHTPESVKSSVQWFMEASETEVSIKHGKIVKVLMFNVTGEREFEPLLSSLVTCCFDCAVFCPHEISAEGTYLDLSPKLPICEEMKKTWESLSQIQNCELNPIINQPNTNETDAHHISGARDIQMSEHEKKSQAENNVTFGCFLEALHWVTQGRVGALPQIPYDVGDSAMIRSADHVQVLCTGSMLLVGSLLSFIHPDVYERVN